MNARLLRTSKWLGAREMELALIVHRERAEERPRSSYSRVGLTTDSLPRGCALASSAANFSSVSGPSGFFRNSSSNRADARSLSASKARELSISVNTGRRESSVAFGGSVGVVN